MRYTIAEFAGDYYYREVHIDEVMRKAVIGVTDPNQLPKTMRDIDYIV